jgi:hypothetical protein
MAERRKGRHQSAFDLGSNFGASLTDWSVEPKVKPQVSVAPEQFVEAPVSEGPVGPRVFKKINELWRSLDIPYPNLGIDGYGREINGLQVFMHWKDYDSKDKARRGYEAKVLGLDGNAYLEFLLDIKGVVVSFVVWQKDPGREGDPFVFDTYGKFEGENLSEFSHVKVVDVEGLKYEYGECLVEQFFRANDGHCFKMFGKMELVEEGCWEWTGRGLQQREVSKQEGREAVEAWLKDFKGIQSLKQDGQETPRTTST